MILKLCMKHWGLKLYKVYIYDDPGLTLTYFICFCTYSRPRYQVSVYRTIGPLVKIYVDPRAFVVNVIIILCTCLWWNRRNHMTVQKQMSHVMKKPALNICENYYTDLDQLLGNHPADLRLWFCFKVEFFLILNRKFHVSLSYLLWLYSPICVGLGRKPHRQFFF